MNIPENSMLEKKESEKKKNKNKKSDKRKKAKSSKTKKVDLKQLKEALKKVDAYKTKLKQTQNKLEEQQSLNVQLQNKIFAKLDEYASQQINPFESISKGDAAIGFKRKEDGMIHCGRNICITQNDYDNAKNKIKEGDTEFGRFIKEIAVTIIGILKKTSVTGRGCNRTGAPPKPQVNQTKLGAVYVTGIYQYYLATVQKFDPVKIKLELKQVATYIAQKMCDLTRKRTNKKKTKKSASNINEYHDKEGEEEEDEDNDKEDDENNDDEQGVQSDEDQESDDDEETDESNDSENEKDDDDQNNDEDIDGAGIGNTDNPE